MIKVISYEMSKLSYNEIVEKYTTNDGIYEKVNIEDAAFRVYKFQDNIILSTTIDNSYFGKGNCRKAKNICDIKIVSKAYYKDNDKQFYDIYRNKHNGYGYYHNNYSRLCSDSKFSFIDNENNVVPYICLDVIVIVDGAPYDTTLLFENPTNFELIVKNNKPTLYANFFGLDIYKNVYIPSFYELISIANKYHTKNISIDLLSTMFNYTNIDNAGLKKIEKNKEISANLEKLLAAEPMLYRYFRWLNSSKMYDKTSNNSLLSQFLLTSGSNYDTLKKDLQNSLNHFAKTFKEMSNYYEYQTTRNICLELPGAKEKNIQDRAKKEWQLREGLANQAEGLGITAEYPKLLNAVKEGKIPISIFHEPGEHSKLINIEFDLWEKALSRKGWEEPLSEIAKSASGRKLYEKNITPYISFLFKMEEYLTKHTEKGKKWQAIPKFVNSQWELEMSDEDKEGTSKKRSALTPLADNENRTITMPYSSLCIHGRQTTYCYSLNYYVFEDNMIDPESMSPVVSGIEKKLNGRDDYSLMYYTLTGTDRNRGYPTFLIIFERLKEKTRVHFHRVHPNRIKNGITTPACKLIGECYRYMCGNIRASEVYAQQGDLIFVKADETGVDLTETKSILEFESHKFVQENGVPIKLVENKAKSEKNRLGFIVADAIWHLEHPEHEDLRNNPPGIYKVLRCKSWEANPTAVWSYTVD